MTLIKVFSNPVCHLQISFFSNLYSYWIVNLLFETFNKSDLGNFSFKFPLNKKRTKKIFSACPVLWLEMMLIMFNRIMVHPVCMCHNVVNGKEASQSNLNRTTVTGNQLPDSDCLSLLIVSFAIRLDSMIYCMVY